MKRMIKLRILQIIPVLLGTTFLSFALMQLAPQDAAEVLHQQAGGAVSEEVLEKTREKMGLNQPFFQQYLNWIKDVFSGNMGTSITTGEDAAKMLFQKLPNTLALMFTSVGLSVLLSIPLGIWAAVRKNKFSDYIIRFFCLIGNSIPGFVLSFLLLYFFSLRLNWFSVTGGSRELKNIILPTIVLATSMSAKYIRQIQAAVLEELKQDYVAGAIARGVEFRKIILGGILKAVMLKLFPLVALSIGSLLGGTAVIETIFLWDGMGKLIIDAITMRDYPVIQVYIVWMSLMYVMISLLADLAYFVLDPRIKYGEEDVYEKN